MTLNTVQTAQRQRAITGGYKKKFRECCQDFLQDPEGEDFKVLDRNKQHLQSTESSPDPSTSKFLQQAPTGHGSD